MTDELSRCQHPRAAREPAQECLKFSTALPRQQTARELPAEQPSRRALKPHDLLATIYHVLGIDTSQTFLDRSGRPVPILTEGTPIHEVV